MQDTPIEHLNLSVTQMSKTTILLLIMYCCAQVSLMAQAPKALPNIVIYLTDDQSQQDASIYGNRHIQTPNLEKLAAMGMTFDNAFVASPACAPSRAALLTGLMPARNGAEENHSYPAEGTLLLPKMLQQKGYEIAAFGKVAHGPMNKQCGFDFYAGRPVLLAQQVANFLSERTSDRPLCLLVGDRRPHVPWIKESAYTSESVVLPEYLIDTEATREHWARYYTDISGADQEMGEILRLTTDTFGDNFLFVYSSDHGGQWPFGKWNLYDAGIKVPMVWAWPGHIAPGTRTQAMVSWIDLFPTLLDLTEAGTPGQLDGRSFARVLQGKRRQHRKEIFTTHSGDLIMNVYPIRSIRGGRFKYILNLLPDHYHTNHSDILRKDGAGAYWDSWHQAAESDPAAAAVIEKYHVRPAEEFYDLEADPSEQHNLIGEKKYARKIQKLRKRLEAWMEKQGDQQTVFRNPYPITQPVPDKDFIEQLRQ